MNLLALLRNIERQTLLAMFGIAIEKLVWSVIAPFEFPPVPLRSIGGCTNSTWVVGH